MKTEPSSNTSLYAPWLHIVRGVWLVCIVATLLIVAGFVPIRFEYLMHLCSQDAQYFQFSGAVALCTYYRLGIGLFPLVASLAITALAVSRRSNDWLVLLSTLMAVSTAALFGSMSALVPVPPEWYAPTLFVRILSPLCIFLFLFVFPDGRVTPGAAWIPLVLSVGLVLSWVVAPGSPFNIYNLATWPFSISVLMLGLAIGLMAQVYRYFRISTPIQKQQSKWIVIGTLLAIPAFLITYLPFGMLAVLREPGLPRLLHTLLAEPFYQIAFTLSMIAAVIAILRYRLWDIDIIIRRTVTYATVGIVLAAVYFAAVILLQQIFASVSWQRSEIITVLSTLAIAALFVPLRNRVQAAVDRHFNRRHYDARQVMNDFAVTVRDETDLERLTARLMEVVQETMQPRSLSIWLSRENRKNRK